MNYLAHVFLADNHPEAIIGNLLGDFVKGSLNNIYNPKIRDGIRLHRLIDQFTDSHRIFRASKTLISQQRRRFAAIIIDIVYDHYLAKNWHNYCTITLEDFSKNIYITLSENVALLPENLQKRLPLMIEEDWLSSYKQIDAIDRTFQRVSRRFSRENSLATAVEELTRNYTQFEADFQSFFPELIEFVSSTRDLL